MGKRGPKRQDGKREANGRISRKVRDTSKRRKDAFDKDQRDTMSVAVEARQRVFGVDARDAQDPRVGEVVGRMRVNGVLDEQQYQAAQSYRRDLLNYRKAISAPKEPGAVDIGSVFGGPSMSDENWAEWANKAKASFASARASIATAQQEIGNTGVLISALDTFIMREVHAHHLEGTLRVALNALVRHYGLSRVSAA